MFFYIWNLIEIFIYLINILKILDHIEIKTRPKFVHFEKNKFNSEKRFEYNVLIINRDRNNFFPEGHVIKIIDRL